MKYKRTAIEGNIGLQCMYCSNAARHDAAEGRAGVLRLFGLTGLPHPLLHCQQYIQD